MEKIEYSIIIPCLNGGEDITECVNEAFMLLYRYGMSGEVIVADNMSSDSSVKKASARGAIVVSTPQFGWGNAVRNGIMSARGKYIIICDISCDYGAFPDFARLLAHGNRFVTGSRFTDKKHQPHMNKMCKLYGKLGAKLINSKYGCKITDLSSGMCGFRKNDIQKFKLKSGGRDLLAEIAVEFLKAKINICEIPVALRRNQPKRPYFCKYSDIPKGFAKILF